MCIQRLSVALIVVVLLQKVSDDLAVTAGGCLSR